MGLYIFGGAALFHSWEGPQTSYYYQINLMQLKLPCWWSRWAVHYVAMCLGLYWTFIKSRHEWLDYRLGSCIILLLHLCHSYHYWVRKCFFSSFEPPLNLTSKFVLLPLSSKGLATWCQVRTTWDPGRWALSKFWKWRWTAYNFKHQLVWIQKWAVWKLWQGQQIVSCRWPRFIVCWDSPSYPWGSALPVSR